MPIDKKIKDAFNDPSLENEDWLLPPDSVFDKIEDEIYPEKKKRRFERQAGQHDPVKSIRHSNRKLSIDGCKHHTGRRWICLLLHFLET